MDRKVLATCAIVGFLGLLSAAFAFASEATRVKECEYPRTPAAMLSQMSALFLILAFTVINVAGGCLCCKRQGYLPDQHWLVANLFLAYSWGCFFFCLLILLSVYALNAQSDEDKSYIDCYLAKPGLASGGGIISLASLAFGLYSFVIFSTAENAPPSRITPQNQGVGLGIPQIPPQSSKPVFVHEDTYNRQQFP